MSDFRAPASVGLAFALSCILAGAANAATVGGVVVPCSNGDCAYTIAVGPVGGSQTTVTTGTFSVDPISGAISLNPVNWQSSGMSASLSLNGNSDPTLGFNFSAGTAGTAETFSLTLSMPISESGRIDASSSVGYTLTSLGNGGASIAPTAGHVVTAEEISTVAGGPAPLNKGVDVGDAFGFTGGPATHNPAQPFTANDMFTLASGNLYNLMSVTVAFSLSANSQVGISGFVQQTPVPLPPALVLLLSGVSGLIWRFGRKPSSIFLAPAL